MKLLSILKKNKPNIKFVYEDDLETYLKSIGIHSTLSKGQLKCFFCGDIVNLSNLMAVIPVEGSVKVVCSKNACIRKVNKI